MKNKILLMVMFITLFFINGNDTYALVKCEVGEANCTIEAIEEYIGKKGSNSQLACAYEVETEKGEKYYNYIYYNANNDKLYGGTTYYDVSPNSPADEVLQKGKNAWLLGDAYSNLYDNNQCPKYSYIDTEGLGNEICFDNNRECQNDGEKLDGGTNFNYTINTAKDTNRIYENASALKYNTLNWSNSCDKSNLPSGYQNGNVCRYSAVTGGNTDKEGTILLIYNGSSNMLIHNNLDGRRVILEGNGSSKKFFDYISDYRTDTFNYINKIPNNINSCPNSIYYNKIGNPAYSEDVEISLTIDNKADSTIRYELKNCNDGSSEEEPYEGHTCETLISQELRDIINDIMGIIRIAVPLLLIGLLVYDFSMAVLSGADDKVSKIRGKAIKRIIIALIIFFVPTFVNLVFNIVNEVWDTNFSTCGFE